MATSRNDKVNLRNWSCSRAVLVSSMDNAPQRLAVDFVEFECHAVIAGEQHR